MKNGMIAVDSEDGKTLGLTSDVFSPDATWLWKKEKEIWLSMVWVREEKRNQGHTQRLIQRILDAGYVVKIPSPLGAMRAIIRKMGFRRKDEMTEMGKCEVWTKGG